MKRIAVIMLAAASIAVAKQPQEAIPASVKERAEAIERAAKSNDMASVQRLLNAVDWREIEDVKAATKLLAKSLPKGKPGAEMRRQLKTKLALLADDPEDIEELAGAKPYPIKIVRAPTLKLAPIVLTPVEIASLVFVPLTVKTLSADPIKVYCLSVPGMVVPAISVPYLDTKAIPIAFLRVDNSSFLDAMAAWERRWGVVLDALGPGNVRVVPHPATALGQARAALMARLERDGWTPATEGAWADYHRALAAALGRRERLNK